MRPEVEIYDTTLRDGSQGEGINFSAVDKLRIAEKLDAFGVHYIEGGWPGSNPKDMEFFQEAAGRKWKNASIAAFSMTRRKGVAVESGGVAESVTVAQLLALAAYVAPILTTRRGQVEIEAAVLRDFSVEAEQVR